MLVTLRQIHDETWTRPEHMLASVIDSLGVVSHHALMGPHADPKKLRSVKPPKPIERPGLQRRKKRKATTEELRELFGGS